jgi:hypothetical protein
VKAANFRKPRDISDVGTKRGKKRIDQGPAKEKKPMERKMSNSEQVFGIRGICVA